MEIKQRCPYGGGLCQHAAIERCGMQLSNLIECKVFWEIEHAHEQFDIGPPKSPLSPPAEMPEVDKQLIPDATTGMKLVKLLMPFAGEGGLNEGAVDVLERLINEVNSHRVDPDIPVMPPENVAITPNHKSSVQPLLTGYCLRWPEKVGKKEPNSCVGCTVGCPGKGKQEPEEVK